MMCAVRMPGQIASYCLRLFTCLVTVLPSGHLSAYPDLVVTGDPDDGNGAPTLPCDLPASFS